MIDLEIKKLETFLADPKYVSESMKNLMYTQLASMKNYSSSLKNRIGLFEDENPGIKEADYKTRGEELIGNFNPNEDPRVEEIKNRATQLINCIDAFGNDPRRKSIAITEIESAQMFAVKSLFH